MSDRMVLLAIFGNHLEAELIRAQLEEEGIRVVVMGATSGDLFAGMGIGVSNVQLHVAEGDLPRATEILDADEDERDSEANDEEEPPLPSRKKRRKLSTAIKEGGVAEPASTDIRPALESPIQADPSGAPSPPLVKSEEEMALEFPDEEDDKRVDRPVTWTADDFAALAYRYSLIGYLTCGFLHLYVLYLIIRLHWSEGELSPTGSRKALAAFALSILPGSILVYIFLRLLIELVGAQLR